MMQRYHPRCWSAVKREIKRSLSTQSTLEESNIQHLIEMINMIRFELSDPSAKLDDIAWFLMKSLNITIQFLDRQFQLIFIIMPPF